MMWYFKIWVWDPVEKVHIFWESEHKFPTFLEAVIGLDFYILTPDKIPSFWDYLTLEETEVLYDKQASSPNR